MLYSTFCSVWRNLLAFENSRQVTLLDQGISYESIPALDSPASRHFNIDEYTTGASVWNNASSCYEAHR